MRDWLGVFGIVTGTMVLVILVVFVVIAVVIPVAAVLGERLECGLRGPSAPACGHLPAPATRTL